jgi:hypothetical protein
LCFRHAKSDDPDSAFVGAVAADHDDIVRVFLELASVKLYERLVDLAAGEVDAREIAIVRKASGLIGRRSDLPVGVRRGLRRAPHREGPTRTADEADGRIASDQARTWAVGRAGPRAAAGDRLLPVTYRRDPFLNEAAARPDLDAGVARPHRPKEAVDADRRDASCGQ